MKIITKEFIDQLIDKYKDKPTELTENQLQDKWADQNFVGWYGFSLGLSEEFRWWYPIIDEVLEKIYENDKNLQIQQIKVKYGGLRFYVEFNDINECYDEIYYLESKLYDKRLAW